jgi:antitoxin component of MazEF toxin-antitoxin module
MVKLQERKIGDATHYFITMPKDVVEQKGWKKGERLTINFNANGDILISKFQKA